MDFPGVAAVVVAAHSRSIYKDVDQVDLARLKRVWIASVQGHEAKNHNGSFCYVAETDGVVSGFIIGVLDYLYHFGHKLMATDLLYLPSPACSDRDAIGMFRKFEEWAENRPDVVEIVPGLTNVLGSYERTKELYLRLGYEPRGEMFARGIAR